MEIELKYLFEDESLKDAIFNDKYIQKIMDEGSEAVTPMHAIYMDTVDGALRKKGMAFRVRFEYSKYVATLKWGGSAEEGLHVRGELNVAVEEDFLKNPTLDVFKGSEIYDEITETVGNSELVPVMEMNYVRREVRVDTGVSISVLSVDEGEIKTLNGDIPILELEIELYAGDKDDMIALGRKLEEKYHLKRGNRSKFQCGLELLGFV
jgi:triphosphatase